MEPVSQNEGHQQPDIALVTYAAFSDNKESSSAQPSLASTAPTLMALTTTHLCQSPSCKARLWLWRPCSTHLSADPRAAGSPVAPEGPCSMLLVPLAAPLMLSPAHSRFGPDHTFPALAPSLPQLSPSSPFLCLGLAQPCSKNYTHYHSEIKPIHLSYLRALKLVRQCYQVCQHLQTQFYAPHCCFKKHATPTFITALFTAAKRQEQPSYPLMGK